MEEKYRIDPELNAVLPDLSDEDYKALEQSLLTDGFKGAPIMVWGNIIVDGHNRYEICSKHDIPYEVKKVEFDNKEEAMMWMVRQQIGRRNLTPLQRISVVQKYQPFYKKKAAKNKSLNGGNKKSELKNSATPIPKEKKIDVRAELANDAKVSTDTYSKGLKILQSGDEKLIEQTMSGEKSINKAYRELKEKHENKSVVQNRRTDNSDIEYEETKAEQIEVEIQKPHILSVNESALIQIKKRYNDYLIAFQQDIDWLSTMEFYQNDEEVTGKVHSDLQNCLEKFKSISDVMQIMSMDDLGIIIDK